MLRGLDIRDMLIIDRLELEFRPGLNILTGETGAGKSILLDALGFVLGWRGRADLVRAGARQGEAVAVFDLPADHPARGILKEAGLPAGDELILRRVNTAEGRKTAWINDRRSSGEVLRALSDTLIELHGQQDDRGLLNPRGHRTLLDGFAGLEGDVAATRKAWRALSEARRAREQAEARIEALRTEEEYLRHAVEELDALAPQPGEDEQLDTRRRTMQAAERVRGDIARAADALSHDGAEAMMLEAARRLDGAAAEVEGRLDAPLAALARAQEALDEAQLGVQSCLEALDHDPAELEATEERLFAIRALARKHDVLPDALGEHAAALRARLAELDDGVAGIDALRRAEDDARAAHEQVAQALTAARRDAAGCLDAAMAAELAPLKMDRAVFTTEVTDADPGPEGADDVAFRVATNPGTPAGPLERIASGGELSRFMLALKVCLSRQGTANRAMIFDEIDRGVGGATADAVGTRLRALADDGGQVLVVTHSPQVAAKGAYHWRVEKRVCGEETLSRVVPLEGQARIDELARMLAGDTITDAARAAARALLDG